MKNRYRLISTNFDDLQWELDRLAEHEEVVSILNDDRPSDSTYQYVTIVVDTEPMSKMWIWSGLAKYLRRNGCD